MKTPTDCHSIFRKRMLLQRCFRESVIKVTRCRRSSLRSFLIDQELLEDQEISRREIRLLLLGTKGSGRNTMVKQLRIHYGDSFPTSVRKFLIPFINANLADAVVRVIQLMQASGRHITDPYVKASSSLG
ncbi:unnamed protein product [Mesocestoides corti]|uniref:Uncharacterized protein n=1 Tax=Mesocestoides corti TaxID=53468 RepID=A0A0R3UAH0_MESCO|nr:unnamed protein product [Mesocestoides corti]